jgi:diphosphomevalonate decarboxylase
VKDMGIKMTITKETIVARLLNEQPSKPAVETAQAYAPANIALAKYWGKRNEIINLPFTSSLSISLGDYGATTTVKQHATHDHYTLNGAEQDQSTEFSQRIMQFLNLFRPSKDFHFKIETISTVPIAAGVASSAAGFAALTLALNQFFAWNLNPQQLSILARLGSGSATRSLWQGFVQWHAGIAEDGMDSYGEPLDYQWPELRIGLLLLSTAKKPISSREAMQRTVRTSPFYNRWPQQVAHAVVSLRKAIQNKDFNCLGKTTEENALAMHATMLTAQPTVCYWLPETLATMQKIWQLRESGMPVYFTQDAGPNLKLLFLAEHRAELQKIFPELIIIDPFTHHAP